MSSSGVEQPRLPYCGMRRCAGDPDVCMRKAVAARKDCRPDVLSRLAGDADTQVRVVVAEHRHLPGDTQQRLAGDVDYGVRAVIAGRSKLSATVVERLAGDADVRVRTRVARRDDVGTALRGRLAVDPSGDVRAAAARYAREPRMFERFLADTEVGVRWVAALHSDCPAEALAGLAGEPDSSLRIHVAQRRRSVSGRHVARTSATGPVNMRGRSRSTLGRFRCAGGQMAGFG